MRNILLFSMGCIVALVLLMAGCRNDQAGDIPNTGPAFVSVPGWSDTSHQSMAGALPYTVGGRLPGREPAVDPSSLPECLQVDVIVMHKEILPAYDVKIQPAVVEVALPAEPMSEPAEVLLAAATDTAAAPHKAVTAAVPATGNQDVFLDEGPELEPAGPEACSSRDESQPIAEVLVSLTAEEQQQKTIPAPEIGMMERDSHQVMLEPELFSLN